MDIPWSVPVATAFLGILAATVTDIKKREVPDWLSYTLMTLGIAMAAVTSYTEHDWTLAWSVLGLALGYAIGAALYYTGQWGGGDAKLLMGVGALITVPGLWLWQTMRELAATPVLSWSVQDTPFFISFLGWLVLCGALYGVVCMCFIIIRHWSAFVKVFPSALKEHRLYRLLLGACSAVFVLLAALLAFGVLAGGLVAAGLLLIVAACVYASLYLIVAIRVAETQFMLKKIPAEQLTEGDWVVGGVQLHNEWIIPEKNIGATKEQIALLKARAPKHIVTVKEGIPFVPSFLAAIIVAAL